MDVYFEENYWGCMREREQTKEEPGKEIRLSTSFTWKGRQWQIPAVYVCGEGLVADFCGRIEPEAICAFYEKWGSREGERLSAKEEERLRQETPFDNHFRVEAQVNGEKISVRMGCGTSWCPPELRPGDEAVSAESDWAEELLMNEYGLDPGAGWVFWRNSFAWKGLVPESLRSLIFTFIEDPVSVSGPHFWTRQEEAGKTIPFVHPATGRTHVLTILGQEPESLQNREFPPELGIEDWPIHFHVLHYQVEPELPDGELLISDCAQSDSIVRTEQPAASSVAVIGGADSFFVLGKQPDSKVYPKRRVAYSALHYTPAEAVEWKMVFRVDSGIRAEVEVELRGISR